MNERIILSKVSVANFVINDKVKVGIDRVEMRGLLLVVIKRKS